MGLFTELRRSLSRLWGRTEQAVGEAYGNEALEYEGEADEARVDAEEAADGDQHGHRTRDRKPSGTVGDVDPNEDGTVGTPAR